MSSETLSPQEEELKKVNARLSVIMPLWVAKHTQHSNTTAYLKAKEILTAEQNLDEERYLHIEGKIIQGTARMQHHIDCIDAFERLRLMKGQEPRHEIERLLARKLSILESIGFLH